MIPRDGDINRETVCLCEEVKGKQLSGRGINLVVYCHQIVFEARNESERGHITEELKLIVSRLGSKIIARDNTVLDDYFYWMILFTPLGAKFMQWHSNHCS